ncbi:MAG: secretion protein [Muribaculaceae bacterium]|nr:secretion protein [Muribaculaceae bacterium]
MNKKLMLFSSLAALAFASASAQSLREGYIQWPSSSSLPQYVNAWNAGTLDLEDEQFFISRVKPKTRFRNSATQVNTDLTVNNDKRLCFWVPLTTALEGDFNLNALPNSNFDSEVFSVWSYVDVFGNWTAPHGWVPGVFADVAHKNGVSVSGVASIPFGGISGDWSTCLTEQAKISGEDMGKFLHYHGVDGLGYNSEFSGNAAAVQAIAKQHEDIITYLEEHGNPVAENIWYDGTNYSGGCSFDGGLGSHNTAIFGNGSKRRASLFFNYNWNRGQLPNSVTAANNMGISPLYIYAGMNMQGGEPKTGDSYPHLQLHNISLGYWGAHQYNMFFLNRTQRGSAPSVIQNTYLYDTERFFTNAAQNPAVDFEVYTQRNHYPNDRFFGTSKFMSARSTLGWSLDEEPFYTFFNIGNGLFFNWMGERVNDLSWYNIGLQDYMPTWRYWWAPELLGRKVEKGQIGMKSTFVWDDAFVGGSCFQISGSDSNAWLHLFKTQFNLKRNDVITVSYKHLAGAGKVSVVLTVEGAESTPITSDDLTFDLTGEPNDEEWVTKEITVSRQLGSALNDKNLALVALHVEDASGLVMNLGQFSIKRGTFTAPATPKVTGAKMLGNHYKGVDGKLFWEMPNNAAKDEPVYNLDVKTSLFKLYAREEGGEPICLGATTSWAGLYYNVPVSIGDNKVQFGVSAVSLDYASESEIAWSEPVARTGYTVANDIALNKPVIKPLEGFEICYVDPMHTPSNWRLYSSTGEKVAEQTGTALVLENGKGLAATGGYDLVIDEGTDGERRFGYYVQVSAEEVGAMPEIYSVSIDGNEVTSDDPALNVEIVDGVVEPLTVSYTGRDADGSASRGLKFNEHFFGCKVGDLGLQSGQSFSVAFWVNYDAIPEKTWALFDITNRGGNWPVSNWGYCWMRGAANGQIESYTFRGSSSDGTYPYEYKYEYSSDTRFQAGSWTHVVITCDYESANSFRSNLYLNGVKQSATVSRNGAVKGDQDIYDAKNYGINATDWISIGGLPYQGLAVNGTIDDFQIWSKAMDQNDVKASMAGLDGNNLPAEVLCFWDFEDNCDDSNAFLSKGSKPGVKAFSYDCIGGENEGQGFQTPIDPQHSSGCPFISGTAYPVVTTPSWSAGKAVAVTEATGTGVEGSAKVDFSQAPDGDYVLTLTLSNSYGAAKMDYPVFSVKAFSGIADVKAGEAAEVHTDADGVFVQFPEEGRYVVAVYDVRGALAAQKADQVSAGAMMKVALRTPGAYVVRVADANGNTLRTAKVIKH